MKDESKRGRGLSEIYERRREGDEYHQAVQRYVEDKWGHATLVLRFFCPVDRKDYDDLCALVEEIHKGVNEELKKCEGGTDGAAPSVDSQSSPLDEKLGTIPAQPIKLGTFEWRRSNRVAPQNLE